MRSFGSMDVADITREDVDRFKRSVRDGVTARKARAGAHGGGAVVRGGTGVANRCLALLSKMMHLAELWRWRPDNSNLVSHVTKYREGRRERFPSAEEIARLGDVLAEGERSGAVAPHVVAAMRLLKFTDARLGEILTLHWDHVDVVRMVLDLPDSKTGRKPILQIFLSPPALQVLAELPRPEGHPFVIAGARPGAHLVNLRKPWGRIGTAAGLRDVRMVTSVKLV